MANIVAPKIEEAIKDNDIQINGLRLKIDEDFELMF